jgi:plastocyanin
MTDTVSKPAAAKDVRASTDTSRWRVLLTAVSLASIVAFVAVALLLGDPEAAVYAGGFAVGLVLLRMRRGLMGRIALALLNANVLGWMVLGAVSNIRGGQGPVAVGIPALLAALALAGLLAVVGTVVSRRTHAPHPGPPLAAVGLSFLAFVALLVAGAVSARDAAPADADALTVDTSNLRFAPEMLEAPAGEIALTVTNGDLFWHTFTIDELDVDVPVAVGARRQAVFEAAPGEYSYYCRIPGHETLMQGTLRVGESGQ